MKLFSCLWDSINFLFLSSQNKNFFFTKTKTMKKLIPFTIVLFLLTILFFPSCKNVENKEVKTDSCCQKVNTDSLIALWNTAWDKKDSASLWNQIADDAMVIDHDWYTKGKDSLFAKWIRLSLPHISNIKTMPLQTCVCCCCVSITGFYTLEYTSKEGTKPERGNFTFIWNQADDKTWKLKTMMMTEFHDKPVK